MPFWFRVFFFFSGLVAIAVGINIFQQNRKLRQWRIRKGKMIESEVTGFDQDFIRVKYKYTVMDIEYIGTRFNVSQGSVADASSIVKCYKPGAIVDVFYNPKNPRECALVADYPGIILIFVLGGIISMIFGIFASF